MVSADVQRPRDGQSEDRSRRRAGTVRNAAPLRRPRLPGVETNGSAGLGCGLHRRRSFPLRSGLVVPAPLQPAGAAQGARGRGVHRRGRSLPSPGGQRGPAQEEDRRPSPGLSERLVPSAGLTHAEHRRGQKCLCSRYDQIKQPRKSPRR